MSPSKADLHADRFRRLLEVELGPELRDGVDDEDVVEILVNPDGSLWFDRHSSGLGRVATLPAERVRSLAASVATFYGKAITPDSPILEANLPFHGARFEAVAQPVSPEGTILSLRKKHRIYHLEADFLARGVVTAEQETLLREAVDRHANLILCGGTGSGKTALATALLLSISDPRERILLLEDTPEIQAPGLHVVPLQTCQSADLPSLVRTSLRLRPDRLILGEVRGPEALSLLLAWNTGTRGGIATLHADSAPAALSRLELLVTLAGVSTESARSLIAQAVDYVVHICGRGTARRVQEIVRVDGAQSAGYLLTPLC
ncbi:MAG TPA: ATPase, T2SS/T4P/T4SS family [Thermoanaerobaculia bacterium]|nr:ATPase, T2SS/T4P/T4SS family [Thermoanaerobaculia bacterium]